MGSTDLPRCVLNVLLSVLGAGQLTLPYAMHKLGGLWWGSSSTQVKLLCSLCNSEVVKLLAGMSAAICCC